MYEKFGLLSLGNANKVNSHGMALPTFFPPCVKCFPVSITLVVRPTLLRQLDMGFLTCKDLSACHTHVRGSGTSKSEQEMTRRDRKTVLGSELNSDALTTVLVLDIICLYSLKTLSVVRQG